MLQIIIFFQNNYNMKSITTIQVFTFVPVNIVFFNIHSFCLCVKKHWKSSAAHVATIASFQTSVPSHHNDSSCVHACTWVASVTVQKRCDHQSKGCSGQQGFTLDQESMQLQERRRTEDEFGNVRVFRHWRSSKPSADPFLVTAFRKKKKQQQLPHIDVMTTKLNRNVDLVTITFSEACFRKWDQPRHDWRKEAALKTDVHQFQEQCPFFFFFFINKLHFLDFFSPGLKNNISEN